MKKSVLLFVGAMFAYSFSVFADTNSNVCTTSYRPKTNETAFAAVGSSLKIADKTCFNRFLIVPFDTKSGAITIPQGEYEAVAESEETILFSTDNGSGIKANSCTFCDPVDFLKVNKKTPTTLCVQTLLNVDSCAIDNSITYTITKRSKTTTGLCAPSLVYFGRVGDTLRFAINDCNSISKPTLNYDLSLGNIIRFLNEEIKIIKADNQGIYYSRMKEPEVKDYSLFTQEQINKLLQKEDQQKNKSEQTDKDNKENIELNKSDDVKTENANLNIASKTSE